MHISNEINYWLKPTISRPCPLCGGQAHLLLSNQMQFYLNSTTVICKCCGFVFTNPMPLQETYDQFYIEAYGKYYEYTVRRLSRGFGDKEPRRVKQRLDWLETIHSLAGMRLLEVGPGQGYFLWWAQARGAAVKGVEPSPTLSEDLMNSGLPCVCSSFERMQFSSGAFDIILMLHVLEHFYDPNLALAKCKMILSDNGLLVIEVPNILKPFRSLDRYFLRYVHPSNFSPQTLQAMLQKHGFSVRFIDEGKNDWRSHQSLFIIAGRTDKLNQPLLPPRQSADDVLQILNNYRRRWLFYLGVAWHAHRLYLWGRSLAYRALHA